MPESKEIHPIVFLSIHSSDMLKLLISITILSNIHIITCFLFTKTTFLRATLAGRLKLLNASYNDGENHKDDDVAFSKKRNERIIERRQWIQNFCLSAAVMNDAAAFGAESAKVCDSTVESYRKGPKRIHIVGTAHVSSISASLAGNLVKEIEPDGVFIELDTQRLNRAFRDGIVKKPINLLFFIENNPDGYGTVTLQSASLLPQDKAKHSGLLYRFFNKIVPNPTQQMYQAIEAQGITPGKEFITAVEEGANIGSIIILGDRRIDLTLQRLAKALILYTDPKKLAEADRKITIKMKERMPQLKKWEEEQKALSADEFQLFVEQMKTKESIMEFMGELRIAAPEVYNALVAERDVFMGRGMNAVLSSSLPMEEMGVSLNTIVAVIGLGHLHGVGRELQNIGWTHYKPPQC